MPEKIKLECNEHLTIETEHYGTVTLFINPVDDELYVIVYAAPRAMNIHFGPQHDAKYQSLYVRREPRKKRKAKMVEKDNASGAYFLIERDPLLYEKIAIFAADIKPFPPVGYADNEYVIGEVIGFWDSHGLRHFRVKPERGSIFIYRSDRPFKVVGE